MVAIGWRMLAWKASTCACLLVWWAAFQNETILSLCVVQFFVPERLEDAETLASKKLRLPTSAIMKNMAQWVQGNQSTFHNPNCWLRTNSHSGPSLGIWDACSVWNGLFLFQVWREVSWLFASALVGQRPIRQHCKAQTRRPLDRTNTRYYTTQGTHC